MNVAANVKKKEYEDTKKKKRNSHRNLNKKIRLDRETKFYEY